MPPDAEPIVTGPPSQAGPAPSDPAERLKYVARRGIGAAALAQVASQLVSLAVIGCLYRLLEPEQFGLLGMALPWVMLLRMLASLGLNIALVQQRELSAGELSLIFWLSLALGALTTAVIAVTAPLLVWFFGRDELWPLTVGLAATAIVAALGMSHQALMERDLRMTTLVWVRLASQLAAGATAVLMAYFGLGAWALVGQQYADLIVLALVCWRLEPWRPSWPRRDTDVRRLLKFGGYYTAASLCHFVGQHADKVLVGRALGPTWLGLYSQAFTIMMKPIFVLTGPLTGIMLPTLSRACSDPAAYRTLLLSFYRLVAVICLPVGVGLALVARDAMAVLGGENWLPAGPLLQALALSITVQGFVNVSGSVMSSVGRADRLFVGGAAMTAALCVGFGAAILVGHDPAQTALVVSWSYTAVMGLIFWPYMRYCYRTVQVQPAALLGQVGPAVRAAAGMAVCVLACRAALTQLGDCGAGLRLATQIGVGAVAYVGLARQELSWFKGQLGRLRGGGSIPAGDTACVRS